MLEHQQGRAVRTSEFHNAPAHSVGHLLVESTQPVPQASVIVLLLRDETGLGPTARNASSADFLRPFNWLPPPMKRVASVVPSLVWMVHTARESLALNLTEHTFTSGALVTCSFTVPGLVTSFSTKVCSHQRLPRCTYFGLFTSQSSGNSRPRSATSPSTSLYPSRA